MDKEKEKYLKIGGSENDEFITKPYQFLENFRKSKPKQEDIIPFFNRIIEGIYNNYYIYFSRKTNDKSSDPRINYLQEQYSNPLSRYQSLAWTLSFCLDGLDNYARYPVKELQYNNIKFLNSSENKKSY
jgi:hypothetical protein